MRSKCWPALCQLSLLLFIIHLSLSPEVNAQPKTKAASIEKKLPKTPKQEVAGHTEVLRQLMQALYTEFPDELAKSTQVGPREMTEWVFDGKANWKFDALRSRQKEDAIALAFSQDYQGDHILALVVGLETLIFDAYGGKNEFSIPSERDEARLIQLRCQLHSLLAQLETNAKPGSVLHPASSRQQIKGTLTAVIERIHAKAAGQDHISSC